MLPALGYVEIALFIVLSAILWIGIPLGIFIFARRFRRAYERRSKEPTELQELRSQLQELQGRVDDLTDENARLRGTRRLDRGEHQASRSVPSPDAQ